MSKKPVLLLLLFLLIGGCSGEKSICSDRNSSPPALFPHATL